MICVVIKGPSLKDICLQITEALLYADLIELRLDHFTFPILDALNTLRAKFSIPMIFTLRSKVQGGEYIGTEENRLESIRRLLQIKPEYFDIESHVPSEFIYEISKQHPEVKLILSYHNFVETPENVQVIFEDMQKIPAFFYKIAVTALNSIDTLRFMHWAKNESNMLIAISMGPYGQISRILAPVIGSPITYMTLEGQQPAFEPLTANILLNRYQYLSLNTQTTLYGLIGDPVEKSISDVTHNQSFRECSLNAIYIKIPLKPEELGEFFYFAKQFPFHGLSVTMPLKEHVLSFLDEIDPQALEIGAVNTLVFENGQIKGFNTDGLGALNAIEGKFSVVSKKILIIGAGGASKAIAYEALRRGAVVYILNRNAEKATEIALKFGCEGKGLDQIANIVQEGYDILINCTPSSLPVELEFILQQTVIMDITTKPKETLLLKYAKDKQCEIIFGYQMFVEQALKQFQIWFKEGVDMHKCRQIIVRDVIKCLEV